MATYQKINERINEHSAEFIKQMIMRKNSSEPMTVSNTAVQNVITDMDQDSVRYNRRFRGVYTSSEPVIFEREAGWREPNNSCYKVQKCFGKSIEPDIVFSVPCTTILPNHADIYSQYQFR